MTLTEITRQAAAAERIELARIRRVFRLPAAA